MVVLSHPKQEGIYPCAPCPGGYYCNIGHIYACDEKSTKWWTPPLSSDITACAAPPTQQQPVGLLVACPLFSDFEYMPSVMMCRGFSDGVNGGNYYLIAGVMPRALSCPIEYYCIPSSVLPIRCPVPFCNTMGSLQLASTCPTKSLSAPLNPCASCTAVPRTNAFFIAAGKCDFCCEAGYFYMASSVSCIKRPAGYSCTMGTFVPEYPKCTVGPLPCAPCPTAPQGAIPATDNLALYITSFDAADLYVGAAVCISYCKPGHSPLSNASVVRY